MSEVSASVTEDSSGCTPYGSVSSTHGEESSIEECIYVPRIRHGEDGDITEHSVIGEGSFGQVSYATVKTETGEEISGALKRPAEGTSNSQCKELRVLMDVQGHRNVLEVLAWAYDGQRATAMLTKRYPFCLRDAIRWFHLLYKRNDSAELQPLVPLHVLWPFILSLAHGLSFLQQHGIVHRDLKPENIMLDDDGQPVIIDFGSAARRGRGNLMTLPVGTPSYLAPEVASCLSHPVPVDVSMDDYSFAMIIAEFVIGLPPKRLRELPPTTADDSAAVEDFLPYDADLQFLVASTLSADPDERPHISSWVKAATAACARLQCGGRSATRPLLDAAASWVAEAHEDDVPTVSESSGAAAESACKLSAAATLPSKSVQPRECDESETPICASLAEATDVPATLHCAHSVDTAAPGLISGHAPPVDGLAGEADTCAAEALVCSRSFAQSSTGACEPMTSMSGLCDEALAPHTRPGGGDDEELLVTPLPPHLSAVATPRDVLMRIADDSCATPTWTPGASSSCTVPSLLQSPMCAGTPGSLWPYAETPCGSPLFLSPRPTAGAESGAPFVAAPSALGDSSEGMKDGGGAAMGGRKLGAADVVMQSGEEGAVGGGQAIEVGDNGCVGVYVVEEGGAMMGEHKLGAANVVMHAGEGGAVRGGQAIEVGGNGCVGVYVVEEGAAMMGEHNLGAANVVSHCGEGGAVLGGQAMEVGGNGCIGQYVVQGEGGAAMGQQKLGSADVMMHAGEVTGNGCVGVCVGSQTEAQVCGGRRTWGWALAAGAAAGVAGLLIGKVMFGRR